MRLVFGTGRNEVSIPLSEPIGGSPETTEYAILHPEVLADTGVAFSGRTVHSRHDDNHAYEYAQYTNGEWRLERIENASIVL